MRNVFDRITVLWFTWLGQLWRMMRSLPVDKHQRCVVGCECESHLKMVQRMLDRIEKLCSMRRVNTANIASCCLQDVRDLASFSLNRSETFSSVRADGMRGWGGGWGVGQEQPVSEAGSVLGRSPWDALLFSLSRVGGRSPWFLTPRDNISLLSSRPIMSQGPPHLTSEYMFRDFI